MRGSEKWNFQNFKFFALTIDPAVLGCLIHCFGWNSLYYLFLCVSLLFVESFFLHRKFQSLVISCFFPPPLLFLFDFLLLDKVSSRLTRTSLNFHRSSYFDANTLHKNFINFWKRHLHVFKPAPLWDLTGKELLGCVLPTSLFIATARRRRQFALVHWTLTELWEDKKMISLKDDK